MQHKRATPFLVTLNITAGIRTDIGGFTTALSYFEILSQGPQESLDYIAKSLVYIQDQIDSLAAVTLQNLRGLDLLPAEKGGVCLFLEEEYCFYVSQSGLVRDAARK